MDEESGHPISLTLRLPSGEKRTLTVNSEDNLQHLKQRIASVASMPSSEAVRLIDSGRVLKGDELSLSALGVREGTTLHVSKQSVEPTGSSASTVPVTNARSSAGGFMPEGARELLNNPMVSAMLENPSFLQAMLQLDPRLSQMAERNPEVRQMLNDPSFLQQMTSAIRNPAIMQEMMRNHDRSLSNIESYPGGMAALSSMYQSMQQEEGALSDRPITTEESNRRFAERLGALSSTSPSTEGLNQTALPNPWAPAPATVAPSAQRAAPQDTIGPGAESLAAMLSMMGAGSNNSPASGADTALPASMPLPFFNPNPTVSGGSLGNSDPSDQFANLFSQLQGLRELESSFGSFSPFVRQTAITTPTIPEQTVPESKESAEEKFKDQLKSMEDMGFSDKPKNIKALLAAGGNTESAIIYLLETLE
ncbi:hypothetical protein HDU67_007734 [Dinochytrium kinnereticum]|nr:hypothetical protein HDU67_007734 [Dinochytrium kinnereticum]